MDKDFNLGEDMNNLRNNLTVVVAALSLGILGACSGEMDPAEEIQGDWLEPGAEDEGMIRFNDDDQVIFENQGKRFYGEYIIDEEGSLTVNIGQMTFTGRMLSEDSLRVDSRGDIDTLVARD